MNSPSRSNSKEGLRSTGTRVFLHAAHACSSRRIQSCRYYVRKFLCICSQAFSLWHGYGFCNAFGLVNEMFSAKQSRVDSSQLPPCANWYCCLTRTPWEQTTSCKQLFGEEVCRVALTVPSTVGHGLHGMVEEHCNLSIQWMSGEPTSSVLLEFLSCFRARSCKILQAIQLYLPYEWP